MRRDKFDDMEKLADIPATWYPGLIGSCLKYSRILAVHPAPKFSGRRADISVKGCALVRWDDIILDICDEEKQVVLKARSSWVFSVSV